MRGAGRSGRRSSGLSERNDGQVASRYAPAVHEQAIRRLAEVTGLVPVEYPTTRQLGASAEDRARDLNAAFADPQIRARG